MQEHTVPYFRDARSAQPSGITAGSAFASRMTCAAPFVVLLSIQPRRWSYWNGRAKPLAEVVKLLADCAGSGGNLTLNVTPDAAGRIPAEQATRRRELGEWMRVHGEAIVGTQGGPFPPLLARVGADSSAASEAPAMLGGGGVRPPRTHCRVEWTSAGTRPYLHVLDGRAEVTIPAGGVVSCRALGGGELPVERQGQTIRVRLPEALRREPDAVLVLEREDQRGQVAG